MLKVDLGFWISPLAFFKFLGFYKVFWGERAVLELIIKRKLYFFLFLPKSWRGVYWWQALAFCGPMTRFCGISDRQRDKSYWEGLRSLLDQQVKIKLDAVHSSTHGRLRQTREGGWISWRSWINIPSPEQLVGEGWGGRGQKGVLRRILFPRSAALDMSITYRKCEGTERAGALVPQLAHVWPCGPHRELPEERTGPALWSYRWESWGSAWPNSWKVPEQGFGPRAGWLQIPGSYPFTASGTHVGLWFSSLLKWNLFS